MFDISSPSMQQCIVLLLSLIVVGGIVALGRSPGVGSMQWAYEIGSQPFYRLLFLLVVLVVASQAHFFPVALMLVLLYLVINSMVPMLMDLPESFVYGSPVNDCSAYNKDSVDFVGTSVYPINDRRGNRSFDTEPVPQGNNNDRNDV
jgi:hypothetical protein